MRYPAVIRMNTEPADSLNYPSNKTIFYETWKGIFSSHIATYKFICFFVILRLIVLLHILGCS